jgi:hypothetical protein
MLSQAGFDFPGRSGLQLDLPEQEAQMTVPVPPARRRDLRHATFQARARRENQLMAGGKDGLGNHGSDRRALVIGRRTQGA